MLTNCHLLGMLMGARDVRARDWGLRAFVCREGEGVAASKGKPVGGGETGEGTDATFIEEGDGCDEA